MKAPSVHKAHSMTYWCYACLREAELCIGQTSAVHVRFQPRTLMLTRWMLLAATMSSVLSEIERLKNCGKRDLCKNRPQESPQLPILMTAQQERSMQCFCDVSCYKYGDCCLDYAPYPLIERNPDKDCVLLAYNQSIFAISKCSPDPAGSVELERLCTKSVPLDSYHYTLDIPVYSNRSGHHFANIYCAMCNGENSTHMETLEFLLECNNQSISLENLLKEGEYQTGKLQWVLKEDKCYLVVKKTNPKSRACTASVDRCPPDADTETSMKCQAYSLPVLFEGHEIYKNAHCAMCNKVNVSSLSCWHGFEYRALPSLSIIFYFYWDFETCDVPASVWDGLRQCCTDMGSINKTRIMPICDNSTECFITNKHHKLSFNLKIEGYITIICLSTSILCLFLHLFLSFFLPHSKNIPGKILNSLSISLLIAQVVFLCGIKPVVDIPYDACQAVAVIIQFSFLSSFFWMNVMSIDIWQTFSNASFKGQKCRSHAKYAFYAWGGAGIVSCVSIIVDLTDWFPEDYRPYFAAVPDVCWFANRTGLAIFFFFPICILLFLNILMFTITVCWFQKQHSQLDLMKTSGRKEYIRLWLYIKLFIIMGLTWGCGMVSSFADKPSYNYPFIILNGLQGTFLFIMFDLKMEILNNILKKTGIHRHPQNNDRNKKSEETDSSKVSSSNKN